MTPSTLSGLTWWSVFSNPTALNLSGDFILSAIDQKDGNTQFASKASPNQLSFQNNIVTLCDTNYQGGTNTTGFAIFSSIDNSFPVLSASTTFTFFSRFYFSGGQETSLSSSDGAGGQVNSDLRDGTTAPYRWYQFKFTVGGTLEFNVWSDPNTSSGFINRSFTPTAGTWYDVAVRTIDLGGNTGMQIFIDGVFYQSGTTGSGPVAPLIAPGQIQGSCNNPTAASIAEQFWFNRTLSDTELSDMFTYLSDRYLEPPCPTPTPTITPTSQFPSPTPTNTITPSVTPTNTPTPSITPTTPKPDQTINFKTLADDFNLMSLRHKQINSFGLGNIDQISYWTEMRDKEVNTEYESPIYPLFYVVPAKVENDLHYKTWNFNCLMMDIVERDLDNQVDTLSDTLQILQDIISQYRYSTTAEFGDYYNKYFVDETVAIIPFMEKQKDMVNGWNLELKIKTITPLDRCAAAYNVFTGTPIQHDWINFKTFHDDFLLLANHHKQLNSFGFGQLQDLAFYIESRLKQDNIDNQSPVYPLLYVIPQNVNQNMQYSVYEFLVVVMDILEPDLSNQTDVLSDTNQILDDIISQFRLSVTDSLGNFNEKYYLNNPVMCMPFLEKYKDYVGGWSAKLLIEVMTPINRCDAAFESFITPTPSVTPTNTLTPSPTNTNTPSPTNTETPTPTQTSSQTPTPSITPTNTNTPTITPTCGTYTVQYLEVDLQSCHNFKLILWNNPNLTSAANAICDVVVSGCAYGDLGTIYCGQETILLGQHQHNFSLQPVLLPGECVSAFTVNTITEQCGCYDVIYNPPTPTPTPTQTLTPTVTNTPSNTPSGGGNKLWNTNSTNWNDETGVWNTI